MIVRKEVFTVFLFKSLMIGGIQMIVLSNNTEYTVRTNMEKSCFPFLIQRLIEFLHSLLILIRN